MQKLTKQFACVSYDQVHLQYGDNRLDWKFFSTITEQMQVRWKSESRQGIYVFTAGGTVLAGEVLTADYRDGMTKPEVVVPLLKNALAAYDRLPAKERTTPTAADFPPEQVHFFADLYPTDGLALRMTVRDLPRDRGTFARHTWDANGRWDAREVYNLDYVWYRAAEVNQFLPARLEPGAEAKVPRELVERLARFHLLNNVRCHNAPPFPAESVRAAELTVRVVSATGDTVALELTGRTDAELRPTGPDQIRKRGPDPIGYAGKLLGKAVYDRTAGRFTRFDLVSAGERWGREPTRPGEPRTPLGFALQLVGSDPTDQAPPRTLRIMGPDAYWGRAK